MNRPWCNNNMPNVKNAQVSTEWAQADCGLLRVRLLFRKNKNNPQSNVDVIGLGLITMTTVQFGGS